MATTIKSTSLDFTAIKNNLKTFLAEQEEFSDYNFEASGLSNILDVLAINTHYNGLIANFALNESTLPTAQLRSSIVSLAEGIGYIPYSKTSSKAIINLSLSLAGVANRPSRISFSAGRKFTSVVDGVTYTFQTRDPITADDNGSGFYRFADDEGNTNLVIYEGVQKVKTFTADAVSQNPVYVIPDKNVDTSTALVKVYQSASAASYQTYTSIINATVINDDSTLYILKEAPNGYYELSFGDGVTLGKAPLAGNKIEVDYLSTKGPLANDAIQFQSTQTYNFGGQNYNFSVTTISASAGGADQENIESIRKNAPFRYAAQNRMVTTDDYTSLVLRNFGTLIKDIKTWGGQDDLSPKFGVVFMSILFNDNISTLIQESTKTAIQDLVQQLAILSFGLEFTDPEITYIEANTYYQFNNKLTTLSEGSVKELVNSAITGYFSKNIGSFGQSFRRSNVLALVDDVETSVLSSRMDVKVQKRIVPILNKLNDFSLRFPVPIAAADDEFYRITSTSFVMNGQICVLRNKLASTKLEIASLEDQSIVIDNAGSYNPTQGTITITGFKPSSIIGGVNYIKISAVPSNQSAISPERNDILIYDSQASITRAVPVTSV